MGSIIEMLNPRSVALIGATEKEDSVGRAVLTNLLRAASRTVHPVNPQRQTVLGRPCFPSIRDVPGHTDLAVIAVPARTVPAVVEECGKAGVAGAIILSAGFGESGAEGRRLEGEVADIRKKYGLRIIGPNCLGVILPHIGLNCTFLPTNPEPGKIALISQSGALGDAILDWGCAMGIGFSMFVSLGSMIDVGFGDLIDFLCRDFRTKSIMIYMEYVGDARRFISAARGFGMSKPIIVLKPGRWKDSARAFAAHTGGRSGDDRVYDAVFQRVGSVRVREVADLFNVAEVLDSRYLPHGPKLAIITNAGGVGIIASDALAGLGGELATLSEAGSKQLDSFLPEQWSRNNPIDLVADADAARYMNAVRVCLGDEGVDGVLAIYTPRAAADPIDLAQALIDTAQKTAKPIIAAWMGGERAAEGRRALLTNNVPAYATPEEAVKTYLYMYRYRRNIELLYETPAEVERAGAPLRNYLKTVIRKAVKERRRLLGAVQSLDLLANYGIPTAKATVVADVDRPREILDAGLPLSLTVRCLYAGKEDKPLLLTAGEEVARVCEEVRQRLDQCDARNRRNVEIVLQKPMDPSSHRLKLLSRRDPEFGAILVLSPGRENPEDVCVGLPPLNQTLARRLLEGTGIYRTLKDTGPARENLDALEDILIKFSDLVVDFAEIESVELLLSLSGSGVLVSDVKVIPAHDYDGADLYPHLVIAPYPSRYTSTWSLPDGTEVLFRPIRPEDEPMGREMLASLSGETLRVRYFVLREIDRDLLIRSCNIDYSRELAIIAEIGKGAEKKMIGGVRLISEPDSRKGQIAILVRDDYQRLGLGKELIDILIGAAQDKRMEEIYGIVLTENKKMLALCKKMGFRIKREPMGETRVSFLLAPDARKKRL